MNHPIDTLATPLPLRLAYKPAREPGSSDVADGADRLGLTRQELRGAVRWFLELPPDRQRAVREALAR